MTATATARIISQVGKPNPPQSIALYGGTIGERKTVMSDLENDLYSAGLNVIDFNARRYLSENDLSQPLIQQIVTELKSNSGTSGATADLVKRINESSPAIVSTQLASEDRVELIHQFDNSLKKLAAISIQKKPLVILIQGLERASTGAFMTISEFVSDYLNINGFMFIISISEEGLNNDLTSSNSSISPAHFLDDSFGITVKFDDPIAEETVTKSVEQTKPINPEEENDLFTPPPGLEVESGADILSKRKGKRAIPKPSGKASSRIFKVRELSGKKTVVKKGTKPKKRIVRKKSATKSNEKVFRPSKKNYVDEFVKPVLSGDVFAVKKFWEKASNLKYSEFTDIIKRILAETNNNESRIRATAITALSSIATGVSWEMPAEVMDQALIMTSDGSKEVRDAAADSIKEMTKAGVNKTPQFKAKTSPRPSPKSTSVELSELDTDSMLGKNQASVASMALGSGSGGVKVMGGQDAGFREAPRFEMSENDKQFQEKKETPKFKPKKEVPKENVPKFKPKKEAQKENIPKFKPKKEAPKFKRID